MLKKINNLMTFVLVLSIIFTSTFGIVTVGAEELKAESNYSVSQIMPLSTTPPSITIYHTNDTHGRIYQVNADNQGMIGIDKIAAIKNQTENAILVDAGDTIHGLPIANINKGQNSIELMKLAGYDVMVPGNHDFNYGSDRLLELANYAKQTPGSFDIISANIKKSNGTSFLPPTTIKEVNGIKVGFFGLSTQTTPMVTNPVNVSSLQFTDYTQAANSAIASLISQGAEVIVGVAHVSREDIKAIIPSLTVKPAVIIDGHDHLSTNETVSGVLIAGSGQSQENLGKVEIELDEDNNVTSKTASKIAKSETASIVGDADVKQRADEMKESVLDVYSAVVAESDVLLSSVRGTNADNRGVRNTEMALGNIVADAMRIQGDTDLALTNGGGLRADIKVGELSKGDINSVLPFGNYLVIKKITPAQLKAALENGVKFAPTPDGRFPQISGFSFVYSETQGEGSKVVSVTIDGKQIDLQDTNTVYTIAINDFLANGGDGYTMFAELETVTELDSLDLLFEQYITSLPNKKITEKYAKKEERSALGEAETVQAPFANIPSGTAVALESKIVLGTNTPGATIYYEIAETEVAEPTVSSTKYTGPIVINSACQIKAIAVKGENNVSEVAVFNYSIDENKIAMPLTTVLSGAVPYGTEVVLSPVSGGATVIRYEMATNDDEPKDVTDTSTKYARAIKITADTKIKARAFFDEKESDTLELEYTISPVNAVLSFEQGTKAGSVKLIIKPGTDGKAVNTLEYAVAEPGAKKAWKKVSKEVINNVSASGSQYVYLRAAKSDKETAGVQIPVNKIAPLVAPKIKITTEATGVNGKTKINFNYGSERRLVEFKVGEGNTWTPCPSPAEKSKIASIFSNANVGEYIYARTRKTLETPYSVPSKGVYAQVSLPKPQVDVSIFKGTKENTAMISITPPMGMSVKSFQYAIVSSDDNETIMAKTTKWKKFNSSVVDNLNIGEDQYVLVRTTAAKPNAASEPVVVQRPTILKSVRPAIND